MKSILTVGCIVTSMFAASTCALATPATATLSEVTGKVLVNSGKGFRPAAPSYAVKTGDQIFVGDDAGATLHFKDANCDVALGAGSVTRVSGADMCQQAMVNTPVGQTLRGSTDDVVITPTHGMDMGMVAPGQIPTAVIVGTFAVASGLALTDAFFLQSNSPPISAP